MFNEHHVSVSIHVAHVRIYRIHVHVHEHLIRHTYAIRTGRIYFRALVMNVNMGTLQDKNKTYMYNNTSLHTNACATTPSMAGFHVDIDSWDGQNVVVRNKGWQGHNHVQ
jgi:hypothetical protein